MSGLLKHRFDKISMLSLTERPERRSFVIKQLTDLGLCDVNDIDMNLSVKHPFGLEIGKLFGMPREHEYSCAREHYTIIKRAYLQGVERLLVLEDDLCMLKDDAYWAKAISQIPDDFDIISFNAFTASVAVPGRIDMLRTSYKKEGKTEPCWIKRTNDMTIWNAAMTGYSRRGMEFYMTCQEKRFSVADMPIYAASFNTDLVNSYLATLPLAVQEDKGIMPSDIRDSTNDVINYNTQNLYELGINKNIYFRYEN